MPDPTNDINALLDALTPSASGFGNVEMHRTDALRFRAALIALVAERAALRKERQMYWESCDALEQQTITLKARVAELEVKPPADRDLRKDLICAALEGACSQDGWVSQEAIANHVVGIANATLAAMRKGEADGK